MTHNRTFSLPNCYLKNYLQASLLGCPGTHSASNCLQNRPPWQIGLSETEMMPYRLSNVGSVLILIIVNGTCLSLLCSPEVRLSIAALRPRLPVSCTHPIHRLACPSFLFGTPLGSSSQTPLKPRTKNGLTHGITKLSNCAQSLMVVGKLRKLKRVHESLNISEDLAALKAPDSPAYSTRGADGLASRL